MLRTIRRKIWRDLLARKGRTLFAVLSIMTGVFGVTTMTTVADLVQRQIKDDLRPAAISHTRLFVMSRGQKLSLEDNCALLATLSTLPGVVDAEGQVIAPMAWQAEHAPPAAYTAGHIVAFTEGFDSADLEPVARVTAGRFPQPDSLEIAVEQRFADTYDIHPGDRLRFRPVVDGAEAPLWTVVGVVLHPYFKMIPETGGQVTGETAIYAHYGDAQDIAGFLGLSALHVRYVDTPTARAETDRLVEAVQSQTPYLVFTALFDDPADNMLLRIVGDTTRVLVALGVLTMVVAGFLITNVMNAVVLEQRRQIGAMKALGAGLPALVGMYSGVALAYGAIGTLGGLALSIPLASLLAQELAAAAFTYLDGFHVSQVGIAVGVVMGLAVPVGAAAVPVWGGARVTIRDAMTDFGITARFGTSRLARALFRLPVPVVITAALRNLVRMRGRLALTGFTLMLAAASFMGICAAYLSMQGFVDSVFSTLNYDIIISPQQAQDPAAFEALVRRTLPETESVYAGYSLSVGVAGYQSDFFYARGSNLVQAVGIDPAQDAIHFHLTDGRGWQNGAAHGQVILSTGLANTLGKKAGDTLTLTIGGHTATYQIAGIDRYEFENIFFDWRDLAQRAGYVDANGAPQPGVFYIKLRGDPHWTAVDDHIADLSDALRANGIHATLNNETYLETQAVQQVDALGMALAIGAGVMGAVSAIGLMAALAMGVFERQREIGIMRSVGARSATIMNQFMLEAVLVGVLAWLVALPLSVVLGQSLMATMPFDYIVYRYAPFLPPAGLVAVVLLASLSGLGPAAAAARQTVASILRYA